MSVPRRRSALAYYAAAALLGAGCGGSTGPDAPATTKTAAVVVSPTTSSLSLGAKLPLQAMAQDENGKIVPDASIFWSSSDTAIATVSPAGVVTAKQLGTAQVSANAAGKFAISTITVVRVPVASVAVVPGNGTVTAGSTIALGTVAYDAAGAILDNRAVVWSTSAPGVATVDDDGYVLGVAAGTATITATSEGKSGSSTITVNAAPAPAPDPDPTPDPTPEPTPAVVDHIVLDQVAVTLLRRSALDVTARVYDQDGNVLTGHTVTWTSSNPSRASVTSTGATTAVVKAGNKTGKATITATVDGKSAQLLVLVVETL